ncbi:hypothetical protein E1A91_D08G242500v1 [Gossypium mustelinum]|uniref:Uncharacterized protein n=1 Tax=Gossypium mustelinum TaxID=34275 RepID=A0A5D2U2G1_GOSMU|nr:hypothetical protein E1A91_D08G242500v1 [Gossypium mustelinum]
MFAMFDCELLGFYQDGRRAGGGGMDGCGLVGSQTDENLTSANWELNWKSHGHSPQLSNGEGCRMLRNVSSTIRDGCFVKSS